MADKLSGSYTCPTFFLEHPNEDRNIMPQTGWINMTRGFISGWIPNTMSRVQLVMSGDSNISFSMSIFNALKDHLA